MQNFSGLIGYYRRFVDGFSKIAVPMTELTRKSMRFPWSDRREASLQGKLVVYCDSFRMCVGCMLIQEGGE